MALSRALASPALFLTSTFSSSVQPVIKIPFTIISSISIPRRKFSHRKNYLRQKLLKTRLKPYPNSLIFELTPENTVILTESPPEENSSFPCDQVLQGGMEGEGLEVQENPQVQVAESVKIMNNNTGNVSKDSVFKFGLWLVGVFMFGTICAVWVLGSVDSTDKDKDEILEVGVNGKRKSKSKLLVNNEKGIENCTYLDEKEMEKRIEEIRLMAREARERERLKVKKNKEDEEDFGKSGIEKEVIDRLIKLRKRLENFPVTLMDNVKKAADSKDGGEKNYLNGKEGNVEHMFKKKYNFRGSLSVRADKPKGFIPSVPEEVIKDDEGELLMNGGIGSNRVDVLGDEWELDVPGGDSAACMPMRLEEVKEKKQTLEATKSSRTMGKKSIKERKRRKQGKRVDLKESHSNGLTQDREQGRSPIEPLMSRKSRVLETTALSSEHSFLDRNDDLKSRETENKQAAEIGHKKSESKSKHWWLSLPYVLVILMRRGLDGEGPQGLFTLRSSSDVKSNLSHTVAFEDRGDATNFCYLLQSFFEELEDFNAEIVPLTIKELDEAVKSDFTKLIVVKKGQLKLYAGQPLPDVEMALRSLVGQS